MKVIPFVSAIDVKSSNQQAAQIIADYEGLKGHAKAIENVNNKKTN